MTRAITRATPWAAIALLATVCAAGAMDHGTHADAHAGMTTLADGAAVPWAPAPASLPHGMDLAVIHGDPSKPGPFTLRVRMPPHTVIAPHTHTADENLTVLSGSIDHDTGATIDKGRSVHVGAQGFVYLPGNMPHALWTDAEPAVLQVTGTGPFGLTYVNPADDPSRKASAE